MGNACVVQTAVESVGNSVELSIRIHSCGISTTKGSYLLIIVKASITSKLTLSCLTGSCPYIPSFCFRYKSGDSYMLKCCLNGLMEESSLSPLYWLFYLKLLFLSGSFYIHLMPILLRILFAFL